MGDPVWLPDVLKAAGLKVRVHQPHPGCGGAFENGHGDFGDIWGMMFHHTGSFGETEMGIAHHPTLDLCSQALVLPDGTWVICGVGIAWHAGEGSYPGIARDNGNQVLIGVEVANDGGGTPGKPHRTGWPDVQYNSVVTGFAACLKHMGKPAVRAIGHKEYAGAAQGKWDPGAIDMNIWRRDVQRVIDGGNLEGGNSVWSEQFKNFLGNMVSYSTAIFHIDRKLDELVRPWKQLGKNAKGEDLTLIDAVAEMKATQAEILQLLKSEGKQ